MVTDHRDRATLHTKVEAKTSHSDPETPLIAHSLKERDRTEVGVRKRERKIKRGGE